MKFITEDRKIKKLVRISKNLKQMAGVARAEAVILRKEAQKLRDAKATATKQPFTSSRAGSSEKRANPAPIVAAPRHHTS